MRALPIFRHLGRDRPWLGLAAGAVLFALAAVLRWLLGGWSPGFGPMTFLPAILLAALFGGIRVGLGVAAVCVLVAWVWFFPPYGTLMLERENVITMVVFIVTAGLELYVVWMLSLAINELLSARERSNTLFRELQHRVANNLQFVAALLRIRKKTLEKDSAGAKALEAAENRLDLMSRVHRRLNSPSVVNQPVDRNLEDLCADLIKASDAPYIHLSVTAQPITLDLESLMSVSLIVAELVTNSLKHAFHDRPEGNIEVAFSVTKNVCTLTVSDDGWGLPVGFGHAKDSGLGRRILGSLAAQLHGEISFERGRGTIARLVFPA